MVFRPLPALTLLALCGVAVLCALGSWQLKRLEWKLDLIASVESRASAPARGFDELARDAETGAAVEYAVATATGIFDHSKEQYLFAIHEGVAGAMVFTPLARADGSVILINRGFVPEREKNTGGLDAGRPDGVVTVTGLIRGTQAPAWFTPENNPEARAWYIRDLPAMGDAVGVSAEALSIDSSGAETTGPWPMGGVTRLSFTNNHLQYALTWFGLGATLIGVYLAYHVQKGRLRI